MINEFIPLADLDDWLNSLDGHIPCAVLSIVRLDGSHPTGVVLGLDLSHDEPRYVVRLDGETETRRYARKEIEF